MGVFQSRHTADKMIISIAPDGTYQSKRSNKKETNDQATTVFSKHVGEVENVEDVEEEEEEDVEEEEEEEEQKEFNERLRSCSVTWQLPRK